MMMIKGSLFALFIASVYAAEDKPSGGGGKPSGGGGSNPGNGVRTYGRPYRAGGYSSSGNGKPNFTSGSRWGNRRRRPVNGLWSGRIRRRRPRPANWVRPSRPANWVRPAEPEGWDGGDSYESTASWSDDGYDECDAKLRATCCDLPSSLSVQDKKEICYAVGCDYDKCDWSDDGWSGDTLAPTTEPTWAADGWKKDGWNDGHYVCLAVSHVVPVCFHSSEILLL